jgi:hypothetical protein
LVPLIPEVRTLACPASGDLLAARQEIQRNPALQQLFRRARDEKQDSSRFASDLAEVLFDHVEGNNAEIQAAAAYLADEYLQLGDGMLIISSTTGRAIYKVTEEDIWQPPDVPRESGGMSTPLRRLRPALEGFLVQWVFDEARETNVLRDTYRRLAAKGTHVEDDPRFLPITKRGRKTIVEDIREQLPSLIPNRVRGNMGAFLARFELRDTDPEESKLTPLVRSIGVASGRSNIADPTTINLNFHQTTAITARIAAQWVAEIARTLSVVAQGRNSKKISYLDPVFAIPLEGYSEDSFWLASPHQKDVIRSQFGPLQQRAFIMPVEGGNLTEIEGPAGVIVIHPDSFTIEAREVHDRWDVVATFEYTLWVDWRHVKGMMLTDLPVEVQIVR